MEITMIERMIGSPRFPKMRSATVPSTKVFPAISFIGKMYSATMFSSR